MGEEGVGQLNRLLVDETPNDIVVVGAGLTYKLIGGHVLSIVS